MDELYIGLMSGTSMDGVDAVIVELDETQCEIHQAQTTPYPRALKEKASDLVEKQVTSLENLGVLSTALGHFFAECVLDLVKSSSFKLSDIAAIGHHGQTVFHKPTRPEPFTLQLGNPSVIAAQTGITTVADFRSLDIALGGQGAPLAPVFHDWLFSSPDETRVVVNIGGISNLTFLHPDNALSGFDSGPGNTLMDAWSKQCIDKPYDTNGGWAATGQVLEPLLTYLMADPFFAKKPPKSTGREYFNLDWLKEALAVGEQLKPLDADIQATLSELTAQTIVNDISKFQPVARIILCGGGVHNAHLINRIKVCLASVSVESSRDHGIDPDWVEATAFAWLARARLKSLKGSCSTVTGARKSAILGSVYLGPR